MTRLVRVLQDDIDIGEKSCRHSCPVAKALTRYFEHSIWVGDSSYEFAGELPRVVVPLPLHVSEFIKRFDNGLSVKPIEFEVEQV
jgi:hypothetical protein